MPPSVSWPTLTRSRQVGTRFPAPSFLMACCLVAVAAGADAAEKPNIVLIMTDDMGWMDLHCQGNPTLRSPQIDGLAKQGVRFINAYAAAPVC